MHIPCYVAFVYFVPKYKLTTCNVVILKGFLEQAVMCSLFCGCYRRWLHSGFCSIQSSQNAARPKRISDILCNQGLESAAFILCQRF